MTLVLLFAISAEAATSTYGTAIQAGNDLAQRVGTVVVEARHCRIGPSSRLATIKAVTVTMAAGNFGKTVADAAAETFDDVAKTAQRKPSGMTCAEVENLNELIETRSGLL